MPETFLLCDNSVEVMAALAEASIDSIVCDPPYGLRFMGKEFDSLGDGPAQQAWHAAWCAEAFRVLKPGGFLLAFGGTRTFHRLASAIEDAGFEIRDSLIWQYGSGFPKSLNVSITIDKAARGTPQGSTKGDPKKRGKGVLPPREVLSMGGNNGGAVTGLTDAYDAYVPATPEAARWEGWGTALKPAFEPVVVARKPLIGTVVANVLRHGTGALNIDGCRVQGGGAVHAVQSDPGKRTGTVGTDLGFTRQDVDTFRAAQAASIERTNTLGRWPANVIFTHAPGCGDECAPGCPVAALDAQSGVSTSTGGRASVGAFKGGRAFGVGNGAEVLPGVQPGLGDTGGASRFFTTTEYGDDDLLPGEKPGDPPFFYSPKASRSEREAGCEGLPARSGAEAVDRDEGSAGTQSPRAGAGRTAAKVRNHHPTVKPVSVMRWLVRLVTPKNGVVLDPFAGSGTTGVACVHEGFDFIGIEREAEYAAIAEARINHADTTRRRGSP